MEKIQDALNPGHQKDDQVLYQADPSETAKNTKETTAAPVENTAPPSSSKIEKVSTGDKIKSKLGSLFKRDKSDKDEKAPSDSPSSSAAAKTTPKAQTDSPVVSSAVSGPEAGSTASVKSGVAGISPEKQTASAAPQATTTSSSVPDTATAGGLAGAGVASQDKAGNPYTTSSQPTAAVPPPGSIPVASEKQTSFSPIHRQGVTTTTTTTSATSQPQSTPTTSGVTTSHDTAAPTTVTTSNTTAPKDTTLGVAGLTGGAFLGDTALTSIGTGPEAGEPVSTTSQSTAPRSTDGASGTAFTGGTYTAKSFQLGAGEAAAPGSSYPTPAGNLPGNYGTTTSSAANMNQGKALNTEDDDGRDAGQQYIDSRARGSINRLDSEPLPMPGSFPEPTPITEQAAPTYDPVKGVPEGGALVAASVALGLGSARDTPKTTTTTVDTSRAVPPTQTAAAPVSSTTHPVTSAQSAAPASTSSDYSIQSTPIPATNSTTTQSAASTEPVPQPDREHHFGRDAGVVGSAGVAGLAGSKAISDHDTKTNTTSKPTVEQIAKSDPSGATPNQQIYGKDAVAGVDSIPGTVAEAAKDGVSPNEAIYGASAVGGLDDIAAREKEVQPTDGHSKAAIGGGAAALGAGSAGAYALSQHDEKPVPTQTSTVPVTSAQPSTAVSSQQTPQTHYGRDAALGAGAVGATGASAYALGHEHEKSAVTQPLTTTAPTTIEPVATQQPILPGQAVTTDAKREVEPTEPESNKGKVAAGVAGAAGLAGAGAYGIHEHEAKEREAEQARQAKEAAEAQKAKAKEAEEHQKALQKQHEAEVKEQEKQQKAAEKEAEKEHKAAAKEHEKEKKAAEKEAEKEHKAAIKQQEKEEKVAQKEAEKEQKKHEKIVAKEEKEHEKAVLKEQKEQEKEAERLEKERQKEIEKEEKEKKKSEKGGFLGLFKKDKDGKDTDELEDEKDESHKGRDAAVVAGTGAAGVGAYEAVKHHEAPTSTTTDSTSTNAVQPAVVTSQPTSTTATDPTLSQHAAPGAVTAVAGDSTYGANQHTPTTSTIDPSATQVLPAETHHGKEAAAIAGTGAAGAGAYDATRHHDEATLIKDSEDAPRASTDTPESERKHRGLSSLFKRKDKDGSQRGSVDEERPSGEHSSFGTPGRSSTGGYAEHEGRNKLHKEPPKKWLEQHGIDPETHEPKTVTEPITGLPMNVGGEYGTGAGGTDGNPNIAGYRDTGA